jgi:hypothetical protein
LLPLPSLLEPRRQRQRGAVSGVQVRPAVLLHDVTSAGHIATNNGLFPAVPGFDLATGIGTIRMTPFIIGFF